MALNEIRQMIKEGSFPELILLHGEESYFVEQASEMIRDAVVPPDARDFNLTVCHGRDIKPLEITEQAMTLPVFSPQRMIQIKQLHEASADQLEGLLPYLENPVPETVLLFSAAKIDARRKFFQILRKTGRVFEFKKIYDNQLPSYVRDMAKAEGFTLTSGALKLFCKRVGTNLAEVRGELDKLISYVGDRDLVEEDDVAAIVSDTRVESIFLLMDALGEGAQGDAMRLLYRLLDEGQVPLMILAMITRHFRQLWKAGSLQHQGVPQKDMPRRVGISPYFLKGLLNQASRYSDQDYRTAFELFLETDLALKSSGGEPRAHLEKLVLRLGGMGQKSRR